MTVPPTRPSVPLETPAHDLCVVTSVHDVSRHLPAFLASIDAQRGVDPARIEVVAVDDGSTDDSLDVLRAWQARSPVAVTVLTTPHGGRAAARSYGLEYATATWVTFPEPCDVLAPDAFARVLDLIAEHPEAELVATGCTVLDDATDAVGPASPLPARTAAGDRVVDLRRIPWDVPAAAETAFLRRDRLEQLGLRFDATLRPGSDDADLCARYLLGVPAPVVGLLGTVRYRCRTRDGRRVAADALDAAPVRPGVRGPGLVDLLERGAARTGGVPEWVQTLVVGELTRIVGADGWPASPTAGDEDLVDLLREVRRHLDRHVIASFRGRPTDDAWRQVLLDGLGDRPWRDDRAVVTGRDDAAGLLRVAHRFTGGEPAVEYLVGGVTVAPLHTKVRTHGWLGRPLLAERVAWLPADGPLRVRVAGRYVEIATAWPGAVTTDADPLAARGSSAHATAAHDTSARTGPLARAARAVRRAVLARGARRTAGAWLVHVRGPVPDGCAALRLVEHLRAARPDVDVRLVVEADAAEVARLRAGRTGDRVVAHGSPQWRRLAVGCAHLVSTAADDAARRPADVLDLLDGPPAWRFTWLREDAAATPALGARDLVVVPDADTHAELTQDGTSSALTTKEVRLVTGLDPVGVVAALEGTAPVSPLDVVRPAGAPAGAGAPAAPAPRPAPDLVLEPVPDLRAVPAARVAADLTLTARQHTPGGIIEG